MNKRGEYLEPVITETRIWNQANLIFAVVLAGVFIIAGALSILLLGFSTLEKVILGFGLVAVYAIILFFLIEPTLLREIRSREIQTIEKPVFRTIEKPVEVDWIMGSAMMTTRKNIEKIGLMEENFGFLYFEDVDWCRRFWEKGLKVVYYPYARMYHYHGKGSASQSALGAIFLNKLTREHIKSALKYFWKYIGKESPHKK